MVANDTLSMSAKNVKIITTGQVVALRGPVKSDKEKADIGAIALDPGCRRSITSSKSTLTEPNRTVRKEDTTATKKAVLAS